MTTTRKQFRATCPVCFREQAIKGNRMVDHGYTIPQDWHQRNGSCGGVRQSHFGTPEGLEVTNGVLEGMQRYLAEKQKALVAVPCIKSIRGKNSHGFKAPEVQLTAADGYWFTQAVEHYKYQLESHIRGAKDHIAFLREKIAGWKLTAPIEVQVEKAGKLIHMAHKTPLSSVLCKYNERNSRHFVYRVATDDPTKVTCARCLTKMAAKQALK